VWAPKDDPKDVLEILNRDTYAKYAVSLHRPTAFHLPYPTTQFSSKSWRVGIFLPLRV
jgi:hypothetical protein